MKVFKNLFGEHLGLGRDGEVIAQSGLFMGRSGVKTFAANVTAHTLTVADCGSRLIFTAATAVTVTVPAGLPDYYEVTLHQTGAGQVGLTGQTIHNADSHTKLDGQYSVAVLLWESANTYTLSGSTGA